MKSPISAKSAIAAKRSRTSLGSRPMTVAFRKTFSRPVHSTLNPEPSSRSAATLPTFSTVPWLGVRTPAAICRRVDFPDPLRPMIPTESPGRSSRFTSQSASKSLYRRCSASSMRSRSIGSILPAACSSAAFNLAEGLFQIR